MNGVKFEGLIDELEKSRVEILKGKNAMYAPENDRLHNFNAGADILGGTPAQACWGYATKHLVALRDKVQRNDFRDLDDLKEKCIDIMNYVTFLWCIGNDEHDKLTHEAVQAVIDELETVTLTEKEK